MFRHVQLYLTLYIYIYICTLYFVFTVELIKGGPYIGPEVCVVFINNNLKCKDSYTKV